MLTPLKFQRLVMGMKAQDLARKVGLSKCEISKIERGLAKPFKKNQRKIARAVGLSEKVLFNG